MPARRADDQLEQWLDTETGYRKAVKRVTTANRTGAVTRSDALALVEVRAQADKHRDRYLKLVLLAHRR